MLKRLVLRALEIKKRFEEVKKKKKKKRALNKKKDKENPCLQCFQASSVLKLA